MVSIASLLAGCGGSPSHTCILTSSLPLHGMGLLCHHWVRGWAGDRHGVTGQRLFTCWLLLSTSKGQTTAVCMLTINAGGAVFIPTSPLPPSRDVSTGTSASHIHFACQPEQAAGLRGRRVDETIKTRPSLMASGGISGLLRPSGATMPAVCQHNTYRISVAPVALSVGRVGIA